ncbi:MAG: tetratricopeptide repeat protein [Myxococcota bacterium]
MRCLVVVSALVTVTLGCGSAQQTDDSPIGAPPETLGESAVLFPYGTGPMSSKQKALYSEGQALYSRRQWQQAKARYEEALADGGYDVLAIGLGQAYEALGQCREAIRWYRYALDAPSESDPPMSDEAIIERYIQPAAQVCPPEPKRMIRIRF